MSLTFEDVWAYTSTIDGWFGEEESHALFEQAVQFDNCNFLEIGCWAGKSSSILLQVAAPSNIYVILVDPFVWLEGDARSAFEKNIERHFSDHIYTLFETSSKAASNLRRMPNEFNLIHIDGDHTYDGIASDCSLYLPKLRSGGVVCVHDYGNPAYPDIVTVLDEYTKGWGDLGVFNTLAIRRKP